MTRRARNARRAGGIAAAAGRLERHYRQASPLAVAIGRAWYPDAAGTARRIAAEHGAEWHRVAAVIAALSPQVRWRENVAAAETLCGHVFGDRPIRYSETAPGLALPGYAMNHRKALGIAAGEPFGEGPGDGFGGPAPKVRAFWAAICGDTESVTLDVWAMRAAYGAAANGRPPAGDAYARGAAAYRAAARRVGESPRDLQAIIWTHVRGVDAHVRDRMRQGSLFDAAAIPSDGADRMAA